MTPRKRGRPKGAPSEQLDLRINQAAFDALCKDAGRRRVPARTLARRILEKYFLHGDKSAQPQPTAH